MNIPITILAFMAVAGLYYGFKKKDPSIELGSCFFDRLAIPFYTFFNTYYSNNGFLVDYAEEDKIVCNVPLKDIYAVKIVGSSTIHQYFDSKEMEIFIREHKKSIDGYFYYVLHKQDTFQAQYVFSHNKNIIKTFAKYYNQDLLAGEEIANVILSLWCQNSYFESKKQILRTLNIDFSSIDREPNFMAFKKMSREAIFKSLSELDILQGYRDIDNSMTNIQSVFSSDFSGSIWFYFDLYQERIRNQIKILLKAAKTSGNKEYFVELEKKYNAQERDLAIVNNIAFLKKYNEDFIGSLGANLKTAFIKKDIFRKDIIRKTPLKYRDIEFDYLVSSDYLNHFIASVHKQEARNPDIFGIDKNGGFINYSFSEENDNPHSIIVAKPGSGKSVSKQKIMAQMIDFDPKSGLGRNLGKEAGQVRLRSYDVGFSDEKFITMLKSNVKNKVAHIESSLYHFRYNLVAIYYDKQNPDYESIEADLQFIIDLTSVILESQGSDILNINEAANFKELLKKIYQEPDSIVEYFQRYRIRNIEETHPEVVAKLLELGYTSNSFLTDIQEEGFDFLKKPLLKDIANMANIQSKNEQISEDERRSFASLAQKLTSINKLSFFSTFDKVEIDDVDVLSMDLNNFKESTLFTPIYLAIFQKVYLKDREHALRCKRVGKRQPKLFYAIEEAKNFFRVSYFETMLEKVALEARKYNVHLCFIVQNLEHVPASISKNLDTRMFLLRPDKKLEVIREVRESKLEITDKLIDALNLTEKYELCVWYSNGVFHIKLPISDDELSIFNTNPNVV